MDPRTLAVYDTHAAEICSQYRTREPTCLYQLIRTFFHHGEPTVDVGCGSGRDAAWLHEAGYPTIGCDPSGAMLAEAAAHYPNLSLYRTGLPDLAGLRDGTFSNVLCSATLMHVRREDLITAVMGLARLLVPEGRLVLSWRASRAGEEREPDGRLYTEIPAGKMTLLLESVGLRVIHTEVQPDPLVSAVEWTVIVAEKSPISAARGLERVQSVLVQDRKVATYKLALIRALCAIARSESHAVRWGKDRVYVPLWSIAVHWLIYYWPFITSGEFIAQQRGERSGGPAQISFRRTVAALKEQFGAGGLYALLGDLDERPLHYRQPLRVIRDAIRNGPVRYAGTGAPVFQYAAKCPVDPQNPDGEGRFGWVEVPEPIWLDISRFDHWIEDSLILRWAHLTAEMNRGSTPAEFLPLLLSTPGDERDTQEVRSVLSAVHTPLECVWTGERLCSRFDVDHMIPFSVWGNNDWWNLLPSQPSINNAKRDALPTRTLLRRRRDAIIGYWELYHGHTPQRFLRQVDRALGISGGTPGWETAAFAGLQETIERLSASRGLSRWEP